MSLRAITNSGEIVVLDDYAYRGVGLPDGWRWMDDADPVIERLDTRVRHLEERLEHLESLQDPAVEAREVGW